MNSRISDQAYLLTLPRPIASGKAAFSSKKGLFRSYAYTDAGMLAGVFFRPPLRNLAADAACDG